MIALGPKYRLGNFAHRLFLQGECQKVQNLAFQAPSFETKQHIVYFYLVKFIIIFFFIT